MIFNARKYIALIVGLLCSTMLLAGQPALDQNEMREVMDIAKRIHRLQPNLDEGKYLEYATGIYRASVQYDIETDILLAITKQETSFREDLPEGAAGELGICQIRKMWVNQPDFKQEFPSAKKKDLLRPAKSFMFAAWILRDLKNKAKRSAIPYWSFYNARKFEPRLRYYTAVSRHLTELSRYDKGVQVEEVQKYVPGPSARLEKKTREWEPEPIRIAKVSYDSRQWTPEPIRIASKVRGRKPAHEESSWIASALKKLQEKKRKNQTTGLSDGALVQAASDLSVFKD